MKRNTYVTAGLFILFGLLTITYWQMSDREDPEIPIVADVDPINDVAAIGDLIDADVDGELATDPTEPDADVLADVDEAEETSDETDVIAEVQEDETDTEASESEIGREVISRLDALRTTMEEGRAQQVAVLTDIIASADYDAMMKSAAKDTLNELQALANSSRMLETVLVHMGFTDVLVDASVETVRVTVQVATLADVPTREELAELYVLAGIEFGNHRTGNISIDFQPLN